MSVWVFGPLNESVNSSSVHNSISRIGQQAGGEKNCGKNSRKVQEMGIEDMRWKETEGKKLVKENAGKQSDPL